MCQAGKTYLVLYKGIRIPIRLENYASCYGDPEFNMFIGQKFIGRHWCVHCAKRKPSWGIYPTCPSCIASEQHKITRALNQQVYGASKLRGNALKQVFRQAYNVKIP